MRIKIINGPNLNLLGEREPGIYGSEGFDHVLKILSDRFPNVEFIYFQSNVEGEIIDALQDTREMDGVILNPAGYTHTSVAIGDAIRAISTPVIEVHISNTFDREDFRHRSFTAPNCRGVIIGFGLKGYELAAMTLMEK
jgi:3-dehydroquinate dehydratase-2